MNLSLGGIVKGITTGLETLVETGNPAIAAGAGAATCLFGSNSTAAPAGPVASFDPLLDEMRAENPFEQNSVNALSKLAQQQQTDVSSLVNPDASGA